MRHAFVTCVSHRSTAALARLTVDHAQAVLPDAEVLVLDLDGSYAAGGGERVLTPADVGVGTADLGRALAALPVTEVARRAHALLVARRAGAATVLALEPGLLLLRAPDRLLSPPAPLRVVARSRAGDAPQDRWPGTDDVAEHGSYHPGITVLAPPDPAVLALWRGAGTAAPLWSPPEPPRHPDRWLDVAVSLGRHDVVRDPATVLSAWTLTAADTVEAPSPADGGRPRLLLNGQDVVALDLTALDPDRPWSLAPEAGRDPRARLSEHPVLAGVVDDVARRLRGAAVPGGGHRSGETTAFGVDLHDTLRETYREGLRAAGDGEDAPPDPFDPASADASLAWLTDPAPDGGPGRYLSTIRRTRPDLRAAFPGVPGEHTGAFLDWVRDHGRSEEAYSPLLLDAALARHVPVPDPAPDDAAVEGVAVVGFLRGELGIGESARQMAAAFAAAGVPVRTVAVADHVHSRQRATYAAATTTARMSTTLLCVNADLTPTVAATVPGLLRDSHRIGMWYWEVEAFPEDQHAAFDHVDEVWVATDFVRDAVAPHSPVPVHTVTPPLPQRGPDPTTGRTDLGLPDGPLFLFSFDYLSTVERKNPEGVVQAFTAAFGPEDDATLVIKSINAEQRPLEAERLRLRVAGLPHVRLVEGYLDAAQRDALVAACDCYVSLHRSEGLGLTMAEAMAWGKPVVATGYSGNLQFMTDENSFLVPWSPVPIPEGADPYPAGTTWAEPDVAAAARLLRLVVEDPEEARRRGARAAQDIATLHDPGVAGRRAAEHLHRIAAQRAEASRARGADRVRAAARAAARRVRHVAGAAPRRLRNLGRPA